MPPKVDKKTNKPTKSTKGQEIKEEKKLDDFFTKFLHKKKRPLAKKIAKIEEYEQKNQAELDELQRELVASKNDTFEKVSYYDRIYEMYHEAFLNREEGEEGQAPAKPTQAPSEHINTEEIVSRNSKAIAQLISVGTYLSNPAQREILQQKLGPSFQKNFGNNFLDGITQLWKNVSEVYEIDNGQRTSDIQKIVQNYLNRSNLVSASTNSPYSQVFEGVDRIATDSGFESLTNKFPPQTVTKITVDQHIHEEIEVVPTTTITNEIKMVKSSRKGSNKKSRHDIDVEEKPAQEEKPIIAEKPDFHKKTAPAEAKSEEKEDEDGWISVKSGARGRGGPRRGGRGGRGGDRGGDKGDKPFRPRTEGGDDKPREERRGGRGGRGRGGERREREDGQTDERPRRGPRPNRGDEYEKKQPETTQKGNN